MLPHLAIEFQDRGRATNLTFRLGRPDGLPELAQSIIACPRTLTVLASWFTAAALEFGWPGLAWQSRLFALPSDPSPLPGGWVIA